MATQVTLDAAKFDRLFTSIERQMIMQSSFLESIYNIQTYQLELDKEREETRRREIELLRGRPTEEERRPTGEPRDDAGPDEVTGGGMSDIFSKLLGLGSAGAGLLSFGNILGVGLAVALAGPIEDFLSGAIGTALDNAGASPEFAMNMGNALGQAGAWATIGSVFGKKAALWFGVAGAASSIFSDEIGRVFDANRDGVATAFGLEMSPEVVTSIGTAMGLGATAMLRYGPIQSKLLMGVATLMSAYGDDAAAWLEEQTGVPADFSEGAVDALSGAAYGASLGAMFGPTGAIIGAIAGLAIFGGASLIGWLNEKSSQDLAAAKERAEKDLKNIEEQLAAGRVDLAGESIKASAESVANLNLYDSAAAAQMNTRLQALQGQYAVAGGKDESVSEAVTTADRFVKTEQAVSNPDAAREDPNALSNAKMDIDNYINYQYKTVDPSSMPYADALRDVQLNVPLSATNLSAEYISEAQRYMESQLKKRYGIVQLTPDQIKTGYVEYANSRTQQTRASKISDAATMPSTSGAGPIIAGSGNVTNTRGGDTLVNYFTNNYGSTANKALDQGNSVPKLQYSLP